MEPFSLSLRAREITGDEVKRLGREAYEATAAEARDIVRRTARRQGFTETPMELYPERRLEEAARSWDEIVDKIVRLHI